MSKSLPKINPAKKLPSFVQQALIALENKDFEAFVVGGCVRDILMGSEPKDWDITTNARPEETLKIFADSKYENDFGTVIVPFHDIENVPVVEITTYRSESNYDDHRHPSEVCFEDKLENDLSRRDFTINAMAMSLSGDIVDYYGGQKDLDKKVIRTVGEPLDRFKEDALRLLRAIRFSGRFGFTIEPKTERAMVKLAGSIKFIAKERVRDEITKILAGPNPYYGFKKLYETKLLQYILPELTDGYGIEQNHHHVYTIFEHNLLSLKHCPSNDPMVRLAALLHDIGKTKAKKTISGQVTFYNHEYISAKQTKKIMERLRFSNQDTDRVVNLVRNHMFYYNVGEVTEASVRRLIAKTGEQNLADLIDLRIADRLGSGTVKAKPYKLRHLEYMFDKVRHDPVSVKMLKINGHDLMTEFKLAPGPQIGAILDVILADVIENPALNEHQALLNLVEPLTKLDLAELRQRAKEVIAEERQAEDQAIR
ncbi:MAG TPA: HD domain-containing protein, partial [bacterium]|nr:HD domain-containing protein [bacterium]